MKIFLNPGHAPNGNPDGGASGFGLIEALVVKECSYLVQKYLEAVGIDVVSLQSDSLEEICDTANNSNVDYFISIHCNAFNEAAKGTETYYYKGNIKGMKLAKAIQNQIIATLETVDRGIKDGSRLYVIRNTDAPAVLVELAFIDNYEDNRLLKASLDEFARAIARGVTDFQQEIS